MRDALPCPRCGYDLSGAVDAWRDQCPLEGVCPECGGRFAWGDRFRFGACPWLFEWHGRRLFQRLFVTIGRALRPWSFFKSIRQVRGRPTDALSAGMMIILIIHFLTIALSFLGRGPNPVWPYASGPYGRHVMPNPIAGMWSYIGFIATLLVPVVIALLPMPWRHAPATRRDLVRPASYSMVLPLVMMIVLIGAWLVEVHDLDTVLDDAAGVEWVSAAWARAVSWRLAEWIGVYLLLLAAFWGYALRDYVGLRRPFLCAGAATLLSATAAATVLGMAASPGARRRMYWDLHPLPTIVEDFLARFGLAIAGGPWA